MPKKDNVTKENLSTTPFHDQRLVTDLVAELAIVLHEKAILENKNTDLKLECQELKHKFTNYEQTSSEEENRLLQNIKKAQLTLHEKEIALAEKDVKCLQEQKKYLKEINELKTTYSKQKDLFRKNELELTKEIELLKSKLNETNNNADRQRKMAGAYNNKYVTYKAKLKHAIGIISTLTATLQTYEQKPLMVSRECQTEKRMCDGCTSLTSLHNKHITAKHENIILTELFFKPHPSDNEIQTIFFMPHGSNDNLKKVAFK